MKEIAFFEKSTRVAEAGRAFGNAPKRRTKRDAQKMCSRRTRNLPN